MKMNLNPWLCVFLAGAGSLCAQPVVATGGVRNSASLAFQSLPNGDIAQGSIFTVFLTNSLPVPTQLLSNYPVTTEFNGASMTVTVGGTPVKVLMFGTAQRIAGGSQLDGILPSSTPLGTGTLTVTFNGQTSAPVPIRVVPSSFAWYTTTSQGFGPGAFTDLKGQLLTPAHPAHPGDTVVGWGTGLSPVTGNEAASGLPGAITVPGLKLFVGNQQVTPLYTGRSSSAGEDQINFQIPAGIGGCAVPVIIQIGNVVSNSATIPIAASGSVCSDPSGLSAGDAQTLAAKGTLSVGSILLDRSSTSLTLAPGGLPVLNIVDSATATFSKVTDVSITASGTFRRPSPGTCTVFMTGDIIANPVTATVANALDAGLTVNLNGPLGAKQLAMQSKGVYSLSLGGGMPYLNPGPYTIDNGSGGADVGAFRVSMSIPNPVIWSNQDSITSVDRSQGVTVTWARGGSDDSLSYVVVSGSSTLLNSTVGASFTCTAPIAAGQFTVPSDVLLALPPNPGTTPATSFLSVGTINGPIRFSASGLDGGYVYSSNVSGKNVTYQ